MHLGRGCGVCMWSMHVGMGACGVCMWGIDVFTQCCTTKYNGNIC